MRSPDFVHRLHTDPWILRTDCAWMLEIRLWIARMSAWIALVCLKLVHRVLLLRECALHFGGACQQMLGISLRIACFHTNLLALRAEYALFSIKGTVFVHGLHMHA